MRRWGVAGLLLIAALGPAAADDTFTWNQATSGAALTKSDSASIVATRALFIGDASACNIAVVFARGSTSAVTLASVQPGLVYPISVTKLMSTNTTCTAVTALW